MGGFKMNYIVKYVLNDNRVDDWTLHCSLSSAIEQAYYWLHHTRIDRCKIFRVEKCKGKYTEVAEIHNV